MLIDSKTQGLRHEAIMTIFNTTERPTYFKAQQDSHNHILHGQTAAVLVSPMSRRQLMERAYHPFFFFLPKDTRYLQQFKNLTALWSIPVFSPGCLI